MRNKFIFILGTIFFVPSILGITCSVIIPCYYGHFKYLPELLEALCQQTELPDEVVISISEANKIPALKLKF